MHVFSWPDGILPIAVSAATIPAFVVTYFRTVLYGSPKKSSYGRRGVVLFGTGWFGIAASGLLGYLLFAMCVHNTMPQSQLNHLPFFGWGAGLCLVVIFGIADMAVRLDNLKLPRLLLLAQIALEFGITSTILRSLQLAQQPGHPKVVSLLHITSVFTGTCCLAIFAGLIARLVVDRWRFWRLEAHEQQLSTDSIADR